MAFLSASFISFESFAFDSFAAALADSACSVAFLSASFISLEAFDFDSFAVALADSAFSAAFLSASFISLEAFDFASFASFLASAFSAFALAFASFSSAAIFAFSSFVCFLTSVTSFSVFDLLFSFASVVWAITFDWASMNANARTRTPMLLRMALSFQCEKIVKRPTLSCTKQDDRTDGPAFSCARYGSLTYLNNLWSKSIPFDLRSP